MSHWIDLSMKSDPEWSIPYYIKGRFLMFKKEFEPGLKMLEKSLNLRLPHSSLTYEVERMKAHHFFSQKQYQKSQNLYTQLLERKDLDLERGERFILERWARRARFFGTSVLP